VSESFFASMGISLAIPEIVSVK